MPLEDTLAGFDRVELGHWPTPVEAMPRLGQAIGHRHLSIKRDDCTGLGLGGNKVRKLEYLVAEAKAQGADILATAGAVQSNHARQTAAAAAKMGLGCHLMLPRLVPSASPLYETSGNVLLDKLFGAELHVVDSADAAFAQGAEILKALEAEGHTVYFIPPGGSNAVGSLGYVRAACELAAQEQASERSADRIFVAASTAGTVAGLVVGFAALGIEKKIDAVMIYQPAEKVRAEFEKIVTSTAALVEIPPPPLGHVTLRDGYLGAGYGLPTDAMQEAVTLTARSEGVVLDPVYTGKAMAALIDQARRGAFTADERVLFWHTGGAPALFADPVILD